MSVEQVADLVDERFPDLEHDGAEEWSTYVARCRARREQRRALAGEYGFSLLDLFWLFHNKTAAARRGATETTPPEPHERQPHDTPLR